jgi:hypothetical protein
MGVEPENFFGAFAAVAQETAKNGTARAQQKENSLFDFMDAEDNRQAGV